MNIIITGASKGIGRETALELAKSKTNRILAIARSETSLKSLSEASEYKNIEYMAIDITSVSNHPEKFIKRVKDIFDHIDILINNAGLLIVKSFEDLTAEDDILMTSTNFYAPMHTIRALLPMLKRGSHTVNIGSMGGIQGSPKFGGMSVYAATKAAITLLTESLAAEYGKDGLSFNSLSFGAVETDMLKTAFPGYNAPVRADEMGKFVAWFAQNGHSVFNGKNLPVSVANP